MVDMREADEESSGRKFFRVFLIVSIFIIIVVLISFIIYFFVSKKSEVSEIEPGSEISLAQAKEQITKCLSSTEETEEVDETEEIEDSEETGETEADLCNNLFLRKDIIKICEYMNSEIKNNCFYEAAIVNNKEDYCENAGELKEICIEDVTKPVEITDSDEVNEIVFDEEGGFISDESELYENNETGNTNETISDESEDFTEEDFLY